MNVESMIPQEVEQDRRKAASELAADSGEDWPKEYRPGSAGCHELLDRTALFADMLERHLVAHPACIARPEWYLLAEQAASALRRLYQEIGAEHLAEDTPDEQPESDFEALQRKLDQAIASRGLSPSPRDRAVWTGPRGRIPVVVLRRGAQNHRVLFPDGTDDKVPVSELSPV